jgi:hypothetical protein
MLTVNDLDALKKEIEQHSNRRIQIETEIKLIKKDLKEKFGVESEDEIADLIKELEKEQGNLEKQIKTKLEKLTNDMTRDGLL